MLTTLPTARSSFSISRLQEIARNTQLVIRSSRKFNPEQFLLTLLKAVCSGQASFNQLAISLHRGDAPALTKQGLHKRIGPEAVAFLLQVITDLLTDHSGEVLDEFRKAKFRRILVEDSSTLRLPKSNAELFPAHGNSNGPTAGVKCNLCYDLLTQIPVSFDLHRGTEQDRVLGKETLALARKGDLVMRDMGYFDLSEFAYLGQIEAFWLTRIPLTVNLVTDEGKTLEEVLKRASGNEIDCQILAGKAGRRCRLVAVRADKKVAEKRRRERHKKAYQLRKTAPQTALIRDGWHLMLTNISKEKINVTTLAGLYRSRWAIEIQFRAWKQSTKMTAALNRKSNRHHLEVLILSSMIVGLLGLKHLALFARKVGLGKLSPEKMMDWISEKILGEKFIEKLTTEPPDIRHVQREARHQKSPVIAGISALS